MPILRSFEGVDGSLVSGKVGSFARISLSRVQGSFILFETKRIKGFRARRKRLSKECGRYVLEKDESVHKNVNAKKGWRQTPGFRLKTAGWIGSSQWDSGALFS